MRYSVGLFAILFWIGYAWGTTYTVDDDGPADFTKIQDAINAATHGDTVQVATGHYYENIDFRGKAITVTSTNPTDPNIVAATIIDANGDGIVVSFHSDEGPESILTGFTITGGHAKYGAGICCWNGCSPTISYCTITDNHNEDISGGCGAGFYSGDSSSPILSYCKCVNNSASRNGGGIYCAHNSFVKLGYCSITENTSDQGGGVYCEYDSTIEINSSIINLNNSSQPGSGIYCNGNSLALVNSTVAENNHQGISCRYGDINLNKCQIATNIYGGVHCSDTNVVLTDCVFNQNSINDFYGGGLSCQNGFCNISDCKFIDNTANYGGGVFCQWVSSVINNCTFINNSAYNCGGGIVFEGGQSSLTDCFFVANKAFYYGGGFYSTGSRISMNSVFFANHADDGGAIYAKEWQDLIIRNSTFEANSSLDGYGAAISIYEGGGIGIITHNIITDSQNGTGIYILYGNAVIDYNNLYNNTGGDYGGWAWPGEHDISVDPCFVQPGYWDDNGTPSDPEDDVWVDGDYHLQPDSLCINAGDPAFVPEPEETDMDGEARVRLGRVDIGADEAGSYAADFDESGMVDLLDYAILSAAWAGTSGEAHWDERCDIAQPKDGIIDMPDLCVYCSQWLWQTPWYLP